MTHLVYIEEPLCKTDSVKLLDDHPSYAIREIAVSALAESPSCGLLMLIDKIIVSGVKNDATVHLVQNLIRRLNKQSIAIAPSKDDNPESFVAKLMDMAFKTTSQEIEKINPLYHSAALLMTSLKLYGLNKLNLTKLEQHWKDFAAILFNEQLKLTDVNRKASSQ